MKGIVYELNTGELCYIGATVRTMDVRFKRHKSPSNKCTSKRLFENGGVVECIVLEEVEVKTKAELDRIERRYIDEARAELGDLCVNISTPDRTKEEIIERDRGYIKANRDRLNEQSRKYHEANPEYAREYREANRDRILERKCDYYEANKYKILEKQREYYKANKERIRE
jgi:hypothetical protein